MLPFHNLTDLTKQLSSKQEELQQITTRLTHFVNHQNTVPTVSNHKHIRENMKTIQNQLKGLKKCFMEFLKSLKGLGEESMEVLKMMNSIPEMYQNMIDATQIRYRRLLKVKDQECEVLKTKISQQQKQIGILRSMYSKDEKNENNQDMGQKIGEGLLIEQEKDGQQLISSMQVTIREYTDCQQTSNCRKITELIEEEEEEIQKLQPQQSQTLFPQIISQGQKLFTFQNLLESLELDKKIKSSRASNLHQKSKKPLAEAASLSNCINYDRFQPKILKNKNSIQSKSLTARPKSTNNTRTKPNICSQNFWHQLTNQIKVCSKEGKENVKGNNWKGKQNEFMPRLGDVRKLLGVDQGIKRFGFGLE